MAEKNHSFLDRHPVAGSFLLMAWGLLIPPSAGSVVGSIVSSGMGEDMQSIITGVLCALAALLILWLHKWFFRPEFEGCLRGGGGAECMRIVLFPLIYLLVSGIFILLLSDDPGLPYPVAIGTSLKAGFCEEAAFRGLPVSLLCRHWREERKIPVILMLTSVCFGVIHIVNLAGGAPLHQTLLQCWCACGIGMLLAAVFLRTGNLWITIIFHVLNDILASCDRSRVTDDLVLINNQIGMMEVSDVVVCTCLFAAGFWLIRPGVRGKIITLWDRKWRRAVLRPVSE